jgi:NADPH:quinone reductase-like Zn-dependent oxidoreductase
VPIPDGATVQEASTLPMNGLTAMLGLDALQLEAGQTLGVTGGAGLLGSYVISLARQRGLRVIADAGPNDEELVRSFGPDSIVTRGVGYGAAVRAESNGGVDGLFDAAPMGASALSAVRDGGAVAVVRGKPASERGIDVRRVTVRDVMQRTDWLHELRHLASADVVQLRVADEYRAERVADAHEVMERGGLRGRAVILF